jgi:hypothetical protein
VTRRVNGSGGGGAKCNYYGYELRNGGGRELGEAGGEGGDVHAAGVVGGDGFKGDAEDGGDAGMGVVGLGGGEDEGGAGGFGSQAGRVGVLGPKAAGDPEGFEVGDGSAAGEVAEMLGEREHAGEVGDGFNFHGGAGAASVKRVVVGVDPGGEGVSGAGDGMRGLEHLAGVEGMEVGVVVGEASGDFGKDGGEGVWRKRFGERGQAGEGGVELIESSGEGGEGGAFQHGRNNCSERGKAVVSCRLSVLEPGEI